MPPGGQIHKSILLKCRTLIHFMICYKITIHCVCKLWTGTMILWFLPIFRHVADPGGQIQKSILLKWSTPIHFMICYKITIHCVCKLWTGTMIYDFFQKVPFFENKDGRHSAIFFPVTNNFWHVPGPQGYAYSGIFSIT